MQIILVQAEIEEALKDYITQRITLTNGSTIQIDLSATRGADGYKATIDILPADGHVTAPATPAAATKVAQVKAAPVAAAPVTEAQDPVAEVPVTEPVEEEPKPVEEMQAEPAEAPKSLFAGISRPKNN